MTPDHPRTRFAIAFTHAGASQPHPVRTAASPLRAAVATLASFAFITSSFAQVVGDPSAGHAPQVITPPNSNNVPVVNINAPSAAGVSHNQYNQFDVQNQGVILNNSVTNANTQLGGWIQGNPNLGGGSARIILNEVTSGNPSMLHGYVEVGGQRAEVIIANPAGITVDGGGFINASGVTLTTGVPQFGSYGNLESYRVSRGVVTIAGKGLDTQGADYTQIIARAAEINSGIWANDLRVTAGTGDVAPDASPISLTVEDENGKPLYAIDVAELGGMYAGKIRLIGTEQGVGVHNAGQIGASVGEVAVTADGQLINIGRIQATGTAAQNAGIRVAASSIGNEGTLYSTGGITLTANGTLTNVGVIAAQSDLQAQASNVNNLGRNALIAAGLDATGKLQNGQGTLTLATSGTLSNSGGILAGNTASVGATTINNAKGGEISASTTDVSATGTLQNRGLVDGAETLVKAGHLDNLGTGRIYGTHLALQANRIDNHAETASGQTRAATIAARERLDIGAGELHNTADALIHSGGDMVIGGALSPNAGGVLIAQGEATLVDNDGATIEAARDLAITAQTINNRNSAYRTSEERLGSDSRFEHLVITPWGSTIYDNADEDIFYFKEGPRGSYDLVIKKGSDIASTRKAIGEHGHYFLLAPSTEFPYDKFSYVYQNGGVPTPAVTNPLIPALSQPNHTDYPPDSPLWAIFGVAAPSNDLPHYSGADCTQIYCESVEQDAWNHYQRDLRNWQNANMSHYQALNERITAFNRDIESRKINRETLREVSEQHYVTRVDASAPGQIIAGGHITLTARDLTNDKSVIVAGGTLDAQVRGTFTNEAALGDSRTHREIREVNTERRSTGRSWSAINNRTEDDHQSIDLGISRYEGHAAVSGSGLVIGDPSASVTLPTGSLFQVNPGAGSHYLVETDPRLTGYRNWLASDFMLGRLGLDPALAQKRLGDGYYEQQLIREQLGELTGHRYLAGYASDEEQYKALMNAGVEYAQTYHIAVGVALSPQQMAALTNDLIWLVSREVTLADGSIETVLVPQLYLRPGSQSTIATNGTLIAAKDTLITGGNGGSTEFINSGTVVARGQLAVNAGRLQNRYGTLAGRDITVRAAEDIDNTAGTITAGRSITLAAGRDIHNSATTLEGNSSHGARSTIDRAGVIALSGEAAGDTTPLPATEHAIGNPAPSAGSITLVAGRDIQSQGGLIVNQARMNTAEGGTTPAASRADSAAGSITPSAGSVNLIAGRDINLSTVTTSESYRVDFDSRRHVAQSATRETGSAISATGNVNLAAGEHLGIRGSSIESNAGDINASARTMTIEAADQLESASTAHYTRSSNGFSRSSSRYQADYDTHTLSGSTLSAERISLASQGDMRVSASNVVATGDLTLASREGDIRVESGRESGRHHEYQRTTRSGLSSGGGMAVSVGSERTTTNDTTTRTLAHASTLGSLEGKVTIDASGGSYTQVGSDVLALKGDVNVLAQDIAVVEARESTNREQTFEYKKSGFTLGMSTPLVSAVEQASHLADKAGETESSRMKLLAAGAAGMGVYNAASEMLTPGGGMGAPNVTFSLSWGSSKAQSHTVQTTDFARGSNITAGGNVNLVATGKPSLPASRQGAGNTGEKPRYTGGNILVRGSNVSAGNNATLIANDQIHIEAARNSESERTSSKSSSSSFGVTYTPGAGPVGFGVSASSSRTRGSGNSDDTTWTASHVSSGNTATLISGGNANIIGSQVAGNKVVANIGGDLHIQSLQDTSDAHSSTHTKGGSISAGVSASGLLTPGGSYNQSKANADGHYASVNEYAGIMAGAGGFDVTVGGNTDLQGAIIASTQEAVDNHRNRLTTGSITTSDIANESRFDAKGSSVGIGSSGGGSMGASKDSGYESSTTIAGVSGGNITITNEAAQQQRTGQTAEEAIASTNRNVLTGQDSNGLNKDWDVNQLVDQMKAETEITAAFGQSAAKGVGDFAAKQLQDAIKKMAQADMLEATDPQGAQALREEARAQYDNWKEGGALRVLAHTVIGGLTGDLSGALGAGSSALAAGKLNELTDNLPAGVRQAVGAGLAAGLGYLTGGNSGMSAAVNQDFNNRQLHDGQKAFLAELAGNDQEKYYLLYAAACSIMKCSEEFATDSSSYAIYSQLESIGNSPALKPYRDLLNNSYITTYDTVDDGLGTIVPVESRVKLFDYNAGDKALDYINRVDNTYHVTIRGEGALKAAIGAGLISLSGAACAGTSGAACAASAVSGTYGIDLTIAGAGQAWTGERQYTQTAQLIEQTTGLSRDQADQILELMSTAGSAYAANKVLETTANALKLSDAQIAALRNENMLARLPVNIHAGQQGKHIINSNNAIPGRSMLNPGVDPQKLLDGVHARQYPIVDIGSRGQPIVNFGKPIGVDAASGLPTQYGTLHYGNKGVHIVPTNPNIIGK